MKGPQRFINHKGPHKVQDHQIHKVQTILADGWIMIMTILRFVKFSSKKSHLLDGYKYLNTTKLLKSILIGKILILK